MSPLVAMVLATWVWLAGAAAAVLAGRNARAANAIGAGAAMLGSVVVLAAALVSLLRGGAPDTLRLPWHVPFGSLHLALDPLSALFALPVAILGLLSAWFGAGYVPRHAHGRRLGPPWAFFGLLLAGMLVVLLARNGVLFLVAWEVMSLAAYFLVTFDDHDAGVREAGFVYLVATQFGTAFLLAFFALMGATSGSFELAPLDGASPALAGALFGLALAGFGAKAGLVPFHVWLPEAHPVAPSHVSALMSGAMIKIGLYGVVRAMLLVGPLQAWWGWTLVVLGLASGLVGALGAIAQRDLKRALAYSTVENAGIISVGLGLGVLGAVFSHPFVAALGLAGALVHVINHALFKGVLFLGAGAVKDTSGTLSLDRLGGLWKRAGVTGPAFLAGTVSGAALPPGGGFYGEFLVLLAALFGVTSVLGKGALGIPGAPLVAVLLGVPLIGGLALAAYARAFGMAFLGEPRTEDAAGTRPLAGAMRGALATAASLVVVTSLGASLLLVLVRPVILSFDPELPVDDVRALVTLANIALLGLVALAALVAMLRRALLSGRSVTESGTWDCGYAEPTARMQYTATSFGSPLVELFRGLTGTRVTVEGPKGWFPAAAHASVETGDALLDRGYRPGATAIARGLGLLRWIQHGRVQYYVLYIAVTLLALLAWKLGR